MGAVIVAGLALFVVEPALPGESFIQGGTLELQFRYQCFLVGSGPVVRQPHLLEDDMAQTAAGGELPIGAVDGTSLPGLVIRVGEYAFDREIVIHIPGGGIDQLPAFDIVHRLGYKTVDIVKAGIPRRLSARQIGGAELTQCSGRGVAGDQRARVTVVGRVRHLEDGVVLQIVRQVPHSTGPERGIPGIGKIVRADTGNVVQVAVRPAPGGPHPGAGGSFR